jgi:hypothetical protein
MFDRRFEDLLQAGIRQDFIRRAKAGDRTPIEALVRLREDSSIEGVCGATRPPAIGILLDELLKSVDFALAKDSCPAASTDPTCKAARPRRLPAGTRRRDCR